MFPSLLLFEIRYQLKHKAFAGFAFLFLLLGLLIGRQGFAPAGVDFNAAYQITYNTALFTLGGVFPIMFFAISGIIREEQYRTGAFIYSSPVKKLPFFLSRFCGVLIFSSLVLNFFLLGFASAMAFPGLDAERLAAFQVESYLQPLLLFVLPNILICSSLIFGIAALTRNTLATYVSAVAIYALYWICSLFLNSPLMAQSVPASPENLFVAALADPFGLSAFFEQTQFWTPFQKNTATLSFSGSLLWNRILWLTFSLLLLGLTYAYFSFRSRGGRIRPIKPEEERLDVKEYSPVVVSISSLRIHFQSFFSLLGLELRNIFKSLPFLAIALVWLVIASTEIYSGIRESGAYGDSLFPATHLILAELQKPLFLFSILLLVFYGGELVWRERQLRLHEILDATPVPSSVLFLSKALALFLLPLILLFIGILLALGFQLYFEYDQISLAPYAAVFYFLGMELVFYGMLSLFLQLLIQNKYAGMLLTGLLVLLFNTSLAARLGMEHPLSQLGTMPALEYSQMSLFGNSARAFHFFVIYWMALGLLLSFISFRLWQRGAVTDFQSRLRSVFRLQNKWQLAMMGLFGSLFLLSGISIYYNINQAEEFISSEKSLDLMEGYERKFGEFEQLAQPVAAKVKTRVDLFPKEGEYQVKAELLLENISDSEITRVLVSEREPLHTLKLENAELLEYDPRLGTYLFQLNIPLKPQQQLDFSYEIRREHKGFQSGKAVVANGTYLRHDEFEPVLGYRRSLEIKDAFERKKRGLPAQEAANFSDSELQDEETRDYRKIEFETILSTETGQTAIAPGNLLRKWESNSRSYFHFRAPGLVLPSLAYFSADYQFRRSDFQGISVEQYYHPGHSYNIGRIEESIEATLAYCQENFGKYPFRQLRIAEVPGHWKFGGFAHPGTISMVEDRLYLVDERDSGFSLVAKRTIHEVAHQYWGHQLTPRSTYGGSLLVEGLAKYTEAVVMERMYGKSAVWQLTETAISDYFKGRAYAEEPEPPLYLVKGQSYLSYGKSLPVLLALRDLIGGKILNTVLRELLEEHKKDLKPRVTSEDFLKRIFAHTPEEFHPLVTDWFKRIITYELKVIDSDSRRLENGNYEVRIKISAKRFETLKGGEQVEIPLDEPIQIGVFTKHPGELSTEAEVMYLQPHRVNREQMEFRLEVSGEPGIIAIDPFGTRLEENRRDNIN